MSEYFLFGDKKFVPETANPPPTARYRVAWDDETTSWNNKCRTQFPGFIGPDNPPAVFRYYPLPIEKMGEFRVDLGSPFNWKQTIIDINGGVYGDWEYLVDPKRATYNDKGWPMQQCLTMSGNELDVLEIRGDWVKFRTLRPRDAEIAKTMKLGKVIHRFTCVTWKERSDGTFYTHHIEDTGTPRGEVLFPVVSNEGYGWIPKRDVVVIS